MATRPDPIERIHEQLNLEIVDAYDKSDAENAFVYIDNARITFIEDTRLKYLSKYKLYNTPVHPLSREQQLILQYFNQRINKKSLEKALQRKIDQMLQRTEMHVH